MRHITAVPNQRLEAIAEYLRQVGKDLARGDSTEHTHRPALKSRAGYAIGN